MKSRVSTATIITVLLMSQNAFAQQLIQPLENEKYLDSTMKFILDFITQPFGFFLLVFIIVLAVYLKRGLGKKYSSKTGSKKG